MHAMPFCCVFPGVFCPPDMVRFPGGFVSEHSAVHFDPLPVVHFVSSLLFFLPHTGVLLFAAF